MKSRAFPIRPAPALAEQRGESFTQLVALMQRLLAPDGCPWDREQTFESMRRYVLEEACEVIDAIDAEDWGLLREELGDLALQVVFLSEMAREAHGFGPDDVLVGIVEKLVRRHPHVFPSAQSAGAGQEASVTSPNAVARQWERIKQQEKPGPRRLLSRIPRSLPPLERARRLSAKAATVGFDWPDTAGSREKVAEELAEVDAAVAHEGSSAVEAEIGDLLFAVVNLARHHGVDPSRALRGACEKFTDRMSRVEDEVAREHGGWPVADDGKPTAGIALEALEGYWQRAKRSAAGSPVQPGRAGEENE